MHICIFGVYLFQYGIITKISESILVLYCKAFSMINYVNSHIFWNKIKSILFNKSKMNIFTAFNMFW